MTHQSQLQVLHESLFEIQKVKVTRNSLNFEARCRGQEATGSRPERTRWGHFVRSCTKQKMERDVSFFGLRENAKQCCFQMCCCSEAGMPKQWENLFCFETCELNDLGGNCCLLFFNYLIILCVYPILSYPTLSILSYLNLSYPLLTILSYLSYLIYSILFCPVLSYPILKSCLSYPISSHPILTIGPNLSYLV